MTRGNWVERRFDECAVLVHEPVQPTTGVPYIGLEQIGEGTLSLLSVGRSDDVTSVKSRFAPGDILFGKLRPYFRKVVRPSFAGICSTDIWVVRPTEQVDAGFLFYWMASTDFIEASMRGSGGTRMPRAQWEFVSRIHRPLPPLDEQRAISFVLSALDAKIDLNRRQARTIEDVMQTLFRSWFVDFDPIRAKAAETPLAGVDQATALFPDGFEDSALGRVPIGWREGGLGTIAAAAKQGVEPGEVVETTPYVGLEHMPRRCLALGQWGRADAVSSGKFSFARGNVLFGKLRPYFHKVVVAPVDGVCSTDILVIVPEESYHGFAVGHFFSDRLVSHADQVSRGTKMPRATWDDLASYQVVIPPLEIAAAHTRLSRPLAERMNVTVRANQVLVELRDYLLPRLLSGELRVPTGEKMVEAAL